MTKKERTCATCNWYTMLSAHGMWNPECQECRNGSKWKAREEERDERTK